MDSEQLADKAQKYLQYDMIQKHTELPDFPRFRTSLLLAFLNKFSSVSDRSELFSLVVSLIQMGLDTHELVPGSYISTQNKVNRALQMKVLAGDYFSSRYYRLLSEGGHVGLIQRLSEAICDVNRLKMDLYLSMQKFKMTPKEFLRQTVAIKTRLFTVFSDYIHRDYRKGWQELLQGVAQCEVIFEEIERNPSNESFRYGWAFWNVLQNGTKDERERLLEGNADQAKLKSVMLKHHIARQLHQMLETQLNLVHAGMNQFGSTKFKAELYSICEPFVKFLPGPKVLEEI